MFFLKARIRFLSFIWFFSAFGILGIFAEQRIPSRGLDIAVKESGVKPAVVAGAFYPSDPLELSASVDFSISQAKVSLPENIRVLGVISPHAGYAYSGIVAGFSYKAIKGRDFNRVILLGPAHFYPFRGISVYPQGKFVVPIGSLSVDREFTQKILSLDFADSLTAAFEREHSLEVQLPFIIKSLGPKVKIVPVLFGTVNYSQIKQLAGLLYQLLQQDKKSLIIVSSDFSHYFTYQQASVMDKRTASYIRQIDPQGLAECVSMGKCQACGIYPILTFLEILKKYKSAQIKILKYANSGDTFGSKSKVVGYVSAVGFISQNSSKQEDKMGLSLEDKKFLLEEARKTLEEYLGNNKIPDFSPSSGVLKEKRGAFVTLHKNGQLRGCIGNIVGTKPLFLTVRDMAIEAAVSDPRFPPVKFNELKDIDIEISVLSPLEKVKDASEIVLGKHGVLVKKGFNQGVFLPQVADETGWSKEEFLSYLCMHKAGLPPDAWKDKDTDLYVFTADVFSESELK